MDDDAAMLVELELVNLPNVVYGLKTVASELNVIADLLRQIRSLASKTVLINLKAVWTPAGAPPGAKAGSIMQVFVVNWPNRAVVNNRPPPVPRIPLTWMQKLMNVFTTSRYGANGLMPLVGRTLALLPAEFKPVIAALTAMAIVANSAADSIRQFRQEMLTSGGTREESGRLRALGSAIGVENMGQMARQLAQTLATNGMAAGAAATIGVHDIGNPYASDLDKAKNLERIIDHITDSSISDYEARRFAILLDVESLLALRDASQDVVWALKRQGESSAFVNDAAATNEAANFHGMIAELSASFGDLVSVIGQFVMPILTTFGGILAGVFEILAVALKSILVVFQPVLTLFSFFGRLLGDLLQGIARVMAWLGMGSDNSEQNSRDRHTDAMNEHSRMLKEGTFGGGARARGALAPQGMYGPGSNRGINPSQMGSFGL